MEVLVQVKIEVMIKVIKVEMLMQRAEPQQGFIAWTHF
jgi:hypothetical protein